MASGSLATIWPEAGPQLLWKRGLGGGECSVVIDNGTLYTMYREGEEKVVMVLNLQTGGTRWEYRYQVPASKSFFVPNSNKLYTIPLVTYRRVCTLNITGKMHCLNQGTGKPIWVHYLGRRLQ